MLPSLIWVTPDGVSAQQIIDLSLRGVPAVQLRDKSRSKEELRQLAHQVAPQLAAAGTLLILNTHLDIALEVGAAALHLPENAPLPAKPAGLLMGRSVHRVDPELAAGCDYLFFGPIFATPSKERYGPPQGVERLSQACCGHLPVYAVGGIDPTRLQACLEAGAAGVACTRAIGLFLEEGR